VKEKSLHYRDEIAIKAFGKKVRALRERKGVTIEEFANTSGLHPTQLGRIERGENNPTISYIVLIAEKLGVKPSELLNF
jgi:transcriptional regulator with XRE-family HTH domain